jgi:dTDP-4-amino-4,6-dideoxygalactose transaminase
MATHLEPLYRRRMPGLCLPVTEQASRETLLLPLFYGMTDDEQNTVITALRRALD